MKRLLLLLLALGSVASFQAAAADPWVTAHYVYWQEGSLPPGQIDFTAISHLIYFAALPNQDGTLDASSLDEGPAVSAAAHAAGKLALLCVGGGEQSIYEGFVGAMQPAHRATFVKNIVDWVKSNGFDGVDIDMEPIASADEADFRAFVQALSAALKAEQSTAVLTADVAGQSTPPFNAFLPVLGCFDQINLETYDLSGNYPGWVTWYDSCLYTNGQTFPPASGGAALPSSDQVVHAWITAGFPAAKLGVGVNCQGLDWTGATGPEQSIQGVTTAYRDYNDIMANSYSAAAYNYDEGAKAPYLSLAHDFISYTDPQLCTDKANYVKSNGLGGLMVWQIEAQVLPNGDQPLLEAIATALGWSAGTPGASVTLQQPAGTSLASGSTFEAGAAGVGDAKPIVFTVVNTGNSSISNLVVSVTGRNAAELVAGAPAATSLAAGQSTTFTLTFTPAHLGAVLATINVTADGLRTAYSLGVSGTGVNFSTAAGTFVGTFGTDDLLKVKVNASGVFTASLYLDGQASTFHGKFLSSLSYSGSGNAAGQTIPVQLQLTFNGSGTHAGDAMLTGSVNGLPVTAYHASYGAGAVAPQAGRYTVLLAPAQTGTNLPAGTGYGVLAVSRTGAATLTGRLGDGSILSCAGPLVGGGAGSTRFIAFENQARFRILGSLSFEAGGLIDGSLDWSKAASHSSYYGAGFSTSVQAAGSRYTAPHAGKMALSFPATAGNALVSFSGGGVTVDDQDVTLTASNKITDDAATPAKLKFVIDAATGHFSGTFFDTGSGHILSFGGLLNQGASSPYGQGYFLGPVSGGAGASGTISLRER